MQLTGKNVTFKHSRGRSEPFRILIILIFLLGGLVVLRGLSTKQIISPLAPTPYPTRISESFTDEGELRFKTGDLVGAIAAYQEAARINPQDVHLITELARIQAYSSELLSTDAQKKVRLTEALVSADKAVQVGPEDSTAHAVRAFVLDWNASSAIISKEQSSSYINEAEQEAIRALQLDNQNALALAFYAEILTDQSRILQASQNISQALERDQTLMDVHRVNAYVQETLGNYAESIREYQKAADITPNLTFLYIRIGLTYRHLRNYDRALEYFAKAATINEQIGVKDSLPYLAIGKTYTQMGEFFVAARNVQKALGYDPANPEVFGTLGMVYYKSRNYESAILALKCATYGCTAAESCEAIEREACSAEREAKAAPISGQQLSGSTVVYYYTYGSALAGMYRPSEKVDKCIEAVKVLGDVRDKFGSDTTIMSIVSTSEQLCASHNVKREP